MNKLFSATNYLYIHDSSTDVYLRPLREAINSIPERNLQIEHGCYPIIIDYKPSVMNKSNTEEAPHGEIILGFGYHHSDFKNGVDTKPVGLVFCLNPPYNINMFKQINMFQINEEQASIGNYPSFMIKQNMFIMANQEFDLDMIVCKQLNTGKEYVKPVSDHTTVNYSKFFQ